NCCWALWVPSLTERRQDENRRRVCTAREVLKRHARTWMRVFVRRRAWLRELNMRRSSRCGSLSSLVVPCRGRAVFCCRLRPERALGQFIFCPHLDRVEMIAFERHIWDADVHVGIRQPWLYN
ncbi:hypothetical protein CABS01_17243, partial [Colletotrichum abscissum]|uniref:uncharacterized protein n=1 Tax=Colletotrichum abscissum TaxID=1671311 RepID=UPI0027D56D9E